MSKVKILGAIASGSGVTLFLENGEEMNLKKDTARTKSILEDMIAALNRGEHVEIDTSTLSVTKTIEEKTNGVVKFVRGRFSQLKALFGAAVDQPKMVTVELGSVRPTAADLAPISRAPVAAPTPAVYEPEELHAVVANKVIPGVEALKPYMDAINAGEDVAGFQKFMERIATVIDKRTHSVQELLNFMRNGDLPIADDGSIVAYKVLQTAPNNNGFVDCHSKRVTQKLGSFVQMDEKLVDPNRRNECSTGLHIARRAYLSGFGGNIITLVKVAPEDVIAVPPGEPDKMRAKGYHIVAVLPAEVHSLLRSNKPMTGNAKAAKLLADVIKGNHTPVLEIVNIGAAKGGDVTVTPVEGARKLPRAAVGTSGEAKALDDRPTPPEEEKTEVSIRELRKKVDAVSQAAATGDMSAAINVAAIETNLTDKNEAYIDPAPAPAKQAKPKKLRSVATKAIVENVLGQVVEEKPLMPQKHADAIRLHSEGKSNRAIEAELHICRKTLKKLFDRHGLKPNG
ncbi:rIIB protector from prophage-induced early lysis protein [Rhizobium phage RHph_N1_15]|nr:rIIB protector from prophage-induced early lysis protein [Rhizobium phage RHph_N1_10]QIG69322.1 rIIB protector from prophage-induced early lysis protein [Rhizobium phage RHph_N1_15]QIG75182.1 rIIB protector from prophage-induced early lysis protein [Rhizobium phage RHph_N2_6]